MKRIILILTLTLLLATTIFAQGMHRNGCNDVNWNDGKSGMMKQKGHMNKPGMNHDMRKRGMQHDGWMRVLEELDLTDTQDKDIRDILEDSKKKAITANAAIEILQMDMHKHMKLQNFKEAMKVSDDLTNAKGELHKNRIKVMEKVYNKLNDAQKEELKKIKEECQDAPQMRHRK